MRSIKLLAAAILVIGLAGCGAKSRGTPGPSADLSSGHCFYASQPFSVGAVTRQPMRVVKTSNGVELIDDPMGIPMRCAVLDGRPTWVRAKDDAI